MKIYIGKVPNVDVTLPQRGSELAAGYDIVATSEPKIVGVEWPDMPHSSNHVWKQVDYIEYETNLYIAPSALNCHTLIHPRSSISKYNLVLANSIGLIDNDYRGMVICRFKYIWQPIDMWWGGDGLKKQVFASVNMDKLYKKGDKIAQLVFEPTVQVEFELVDELQTTQRGTGGFGSTDVSPVPEGPRNEVIIEGEKPKFPENTMETEAEITKISNIVENWKKKIQSASPLGYEKLIKEREKNSN